VTAAPASTKLAASTLARALHPLSAPPQGPGWNHAELLGLLPDGGRNLRDAAVLIGLVDRGEGAQVVLTRRTEGLRHHGGQISFPGGRIEAGDADPVAAALREAHEEIGLDPAQAEALGYLDPLVTITGFHVYPVVAAIAADFQARPDPSEVDEAFEVPLAFLLAPENARRVELEFRGHRRSVLEFQFGAWRVWGATASMLVNLRQRLEQAQ
jgi:8-oxo-dGTP pyrophosphatase MutT (NUDIX family)